MKRLPKEAPTKAGASPESREQMMERKRAAARIASAARNAATAVRHKRHGAGIDQMFSFIDAFERFEVSRGDEDEQDRIDDLASEARQIVEAMKRYLEHEVLKLEEAFNVHRPPNYRRDQARKRFERMIDLQIDGRTLVHHGATIEPNLFVVLGRIHGVGNNKAAEWYYERNKGLEPQPGKSREDVPRRLAPYTHELTWDPRFLTSVEKTGKT